jgi:hypothetical protein
VETDSITQGISGEKNDIFFLSNEKAASEAYQDASIEFGNSLLPYLQ